MGTYSKLPRIFDKLVTTDKRDYLFSWFFSTEKIFPGLRSRCAKSWTKPARRSPRWRRRSEALRRRSRWVPKETPSIGAGAIEWEQVVYNVCNSLYSVYLIRTDLVD